MRSDAPGAHERTYLSFRPLDETLKKRGVTDLQLAQKVGVRVDIIRNMYKYQDTVSLALIRNICEALDCGLGDSIAAKKVTVIPAKEKDSDAQASGAKGQSD